MVDNVWWTIALTDGASEDVLGEVRVSDSVLVIVERHGVTGAEKSRVSYPLVNVLSWRKRSRS